MAASGDVKAEAMASLTKLVRNRRNIPVLAVPQFKRLPDFWGWYKYFMDTHNQEGVSADRFPLNYQVPPAGKRRKLSYSALYFHRVSDFSFE